MGMDALHILHSRELIGDCDAAMIDRTTRPS